MLQFFIIQNNLCILNLDERLTMSNSINNEKNLNLQEFQFFEKNNKLFDVNLFIEITKLLKTPQLLPDNNKNDLSIIKMNLSNLQLFYGVDDKTNWQREEMEKALQNAATELAELNYSPYYIEDLQKEYQQLKYNIAYKK